MPVVDWLKKAGNVAEKTGRVAGAVLEPAGRRLADVLSGEAPEIDRERRQQKMALDTEAIESKANLIEKRLMAGGLTQQQSNRLIDELGQLYSHPSQAPGLMQRLQRIVHPEGSTYTPNTPAEDIPPFPMAAALKAPWKQYASPDGKNKQWFQAGSEPEGWQAISSGGTSRPVPSSAGVVNLDTARALVGQGSVFLDAEGKPWDLESLPPGTLLMPWGETGGKMFWTAATDKGRYETANNLRVLEPAVGGPSLNPPVIGVARTGTTTTQTAPGGHQVVTQTSTPSTGPIPSPAASASPVTGARPLTSVLPRTGAQPVTPRAPLASVQSILPNIQGMTPHNAAMAQKAQPAVTALLGIYGDPQDPSAPSLMQYSNLAADPHAQKVLGEAFKLLDQQMGEISDPGILQTLATAVGWANFRARAESGAQQSAGTQMTDDERAYFDAAISAMADIIGSRAATGQSAARFSVRAIQAELPLIGLPGTPDQASYLTKLQTIGRQIRVGLNAMPDNSRALQWLDRQEAQVAQQKQALQRQSGMKNALKPPPKDIYVDPSEVPQ